MPLLELRDMTKTFGKNAAVKEVNFSIGQSEIVGLLGDNGAGKSTLVRMISGVTKPTSGDYLWNGSPITHCLEALPKVLVSRPSSKTRRSSIR